MTIAGGGEPGGVVDGLRVVSVAGDAAGAIARRSVRADTTVVDEGTFAGLYPRLVKFASVVVPQGMGREDLVQAAVERSMAQRGPALAGVDDPFAYLCRVMVTVAATWGKRDSDRRRRELTAPGTSGRVGQRDLDLVAALSRLPPGQRAVIYFRYRRT